MGYKKELKCDNCGVIPYVLINGYLVAERLLEDVIFEVSIDPRKKYYQAKVRDDQKEYFSNFNEEKWLKVIEDYAEDLDIAQCPKCKDDVAMTDADLVEPVPIKQVPMGNISDVLKKTKKKTKPKKAQKPAFESGALGSFDCMEDW